MIDTTTTPTTAEERAIWRVRLNSPSSCASKHANFTLRILRALEQAEVENAKLRALMAALDERKNAERYLARMEALDGYRAFVGRGRATRVRDAKARLRKANKTVTAARKSVEASK